MGDLRFALVALHPSHWFHAGAPKRAPTALRNTHFAGEARRHSRPARGLPIHREQTRGERAAAPCSGSGTIHLLNDSPLERFTSCPSLVSLTQHPAPSTFLHRTSTSAHHGHHCEAASAGEPETCEECQGRRCSEQPNGAHRIRLRCVSQQLFGGAR